MTAAMIEILVVWFAALLLGLPLFASMGLAAFAFVVIIGMPVDIVPPKIAQAANSVPILASVIFAGMSGSAVADAGGVGSLEIKAMRQEGYDPETAAAITAASATIGPIIPPSLPMVIYGVSADVSIGGLFLAGVIPGLL